MKLVRLDFDVVVVGAGGSGLRAVMALLNPNLKQHVYLKSFSNNKGHTVAAQGGISAALGKYGGKMIGLGTCMIPSKAQIGLEIKTPLLLCAKKPQMQSLNLNTTVFPSQEPKMEKIYQRPFGGMTTNFGEGIAQRTCAADIELVTQCFIHSTNNLYLITQNSSLNILLWILL